MLNPQGKALCPLARTFADARANPHCRGAYCAAYRVLPVSTSHPLWAPAVRKVAAEIGDKPPYAKASKLVADNLTAHSMSKTDGYCGLGGVL